MGLSTAWKPCHVIFPLKHIVPSEKVSGSSKQMIMMKSKIKINDDTDPIR